MTLLVQLTKCLSENDLYLAGGEGGGPIPGLRTEVTTVCPV
jgi:hypothetical protein